jgi:soluble lytic murein transglycosylase-like protein
MRKIFASYLATGIFLLSVVAASTPPAQAATRPLPATPATIAVYASVLRHINPQLPKWQSSDLARRVLINAVRWRLDANMLVAIVTVESRWHTQAVSRTGAIGLGQLMPGTAALLGVDPWDPAQNLSGAAQYLSEMIGKFGTEHYDLAFAAYNAGPKAVSDYGGIPPFDETERYVVKVMSAWQHLDKTVHLPAGAYDDVLAAAAHGPDVDYWLDGVVR